MNQRSRHILTAIALIAVADRAAAAFVITDDVTYNGAVVVRPLNAPNGTIAPTVSAGISEAYNGAPIANNFPAGIATGSGGPWNFYDDYLFTVGPSGSNMQSALISFSTMFSGISDLQARIIGVNGSFNAAANLGPPASGNTLVDAWKNYTPQAGVNTVNLNGTTFGQGTYDLQIRGEVLGTPASGGYGGSITFTPVPLPAALALLLSGIGLLGAASRRSRSDDAGALTPSYP